MMESILPEFRQMWRKRMNLLFVNDDGISSGSLHLLARCAKARGHHVLVCAPATQQSAKGQSLTINAPIITHQVDLPCADEAWAVEGTPADCTKLGLKMLSFRPVDLVISGINEGHNAGMAIDVSGTVGAAREAVCHGVAALAASAEVDTPDETLNVFAEWVITLAEKLHQSPLPPQTVCNVNVPARPLHELLPPMMARVSRAMYHDSYERRISPRGVTYFWSLPVEGYDPAEEDTDLYLLEKGHITVTMLQPDAAKQAAFEHILTDL